MSFTPHEDAERLREAVRNFLEKRSGDSEVRRQMNSEAGFSPTVWKQAAQELGLHGLAIPEAHGGSGASPVELGVVFEEMGRSLFCGPFLATVGLAATTLMEIGGDEAAAHLPGIACGATIATLAWAGAEPAASTLTATPDGERWHLAGTAATVIDGASADLVLVAARTERGLSLFGVTDADDTLVRRPLTTMDSTRKLAELTFTGTPATLIGTAGSAAPALQRATDIATLYLAAEQLGGATRVLEGAVDYAKSRIQFSRPIGSFQSIKHRCADMLVDVESARSMVWHGLFTAATSPENVALSAALAGSLVPDAYQRVAAENIQIHGGIGFTWEHWAHLFLKRAKSSQLLLRTPARHRARLAGFFDAAAATDPLSATLPESADDAQSAALAADVDAFLAEHPVPDAGDTVGDRGFREARFDAGLAVVGFAPGHGGRGFDTSLQPLVEQRFAQAGAADHTARNVIGLGMAMPTIHAHGTDDQKARFLRPAFSGAQIWCQLFSEPDAGSDLAALATRAVRDGDDFVVSGQKVWTSLGHVADWGILLARTDPDVPKHNGLTYFLVDMRSPGIEVRPLRQLTGEAEFNEVYLTQVRVPAANVLGSVGNGWSVAMTTLANERVSLGARPAARGSGPIGQAVAMYRSALDDGRIDPVTADRLSTLWARAEAARLTNVRAAARAGRVPGPEGSIAKLQMAELNKAIYEFCVDISGPDGLLIDGYEETAPEFAAVHGGRDVRKAYLRSLANSIEGGTSEVLRNILGERVLGLPAEPRLDRDIPWKEVRRS